jgi:hypothetical protein
MDDITKIRSLMTVLNEVGSEPDYGPIETLTYLQLYLTQHGNDIGSSDVENMLSRIKYALRGSTLPEEGTEQ